MKKVVAVILIGALSCSAYAEKYFGLHFAKNSIESDLDEASVNSFGLRFGGNLSRLWSLEGRMDFGSGTDSGTYLGADYDAELKSALGLYGKLAPSGDSAFVPYALIGMARVEAEAKITDVEVLNIPGLIYIGPEEGDTISDDETGFSWGLGFGLMMGESASLNLEYMSLSSGDLDVSQTNLGINFYF